MDISPRSVDAIIEENYVKCLEKKAEVIERNTGISKKYLLGEVYIRLSDEENVFDDMKLYKKTYDIMHCIEKNTKAINMKYNKKVLKKEELYDISDLRIERHKKIYQYMGIRKEFENIVDSLNTLKEHFEKEMDKEFGRDIKSKYNQFCKNVRDMLIDKTESLDEDKLMINEKTLTIAKTIKENVEIIKEVVVETSTLYAEMKNEFEQAIDKMDINTLDIEENKDLYCLLYFIINNKKYETP